MSLTQDDLTEEDLFTEQFVYCPPCTNNNNTLLVHDEETDDEDEDAFCRQFEVDYPPAAASSGDTSSTVLKHVRQHAFGVHRSDGCDSASQVTYDSEGDQRSVEVENVDQRKIIVVRGKPERKPTSKGRQEKLFVKKEKALEATEVAAALVPCCKSKCNQRFTFTEVYDVRTSFWSKNRGQQLDWLTHELSFWGVPDPETGTFKFRYTINGKDCCAKFLEQALPVSHGRLVECRKRVLALDFENSSRSPTVPNAPMADRIEKFISTYVEQQCGAMPTKDKKAELPTGCTKDKVYVEYLLSFSEDEMHNSASLTYWYKVWREKWPTVKANNRANRFSKCSICSNIKVLKSFASAQQKGNSCWHDFSPCPLELMLA